MRPRLAALGVAATTVLAVSSGAAAHADPVKNGFPVDITCNGTKYHTVVSGNGAFTPAHDLSSTAMLVPVAFGPITVTIRDAKGNVVATETEPAVNKGSSTKNPHATTTCSFTSTFAEDGLTGTVVGTVTGFLTPAR